MSKAFTLALISMYFSNSMFLRRRLNVAWISHTHPHSTHFTLCLFQQKWSGLWSTIYFFAEKCCWWTHLRRRGLWKEARYGNRLLPKQPSISCDSEVSAGSSGSFTKNYQKKMRQEEHSSGISPESSELDQLIEDINEVEQVADAEHQEQSRM